MADTIAVKRIVMLEGYEPMKRKSRKGSKLAKVARACARAGKKPGTKAWGSCVRAGFKKRSRKSKR